MHVSMRRSGRIPTSKRSTDMCRTDNIRDTEDRILESWVRDPPCEEDRARIRPHLELASTALGP